MAPTSDMHASFVALEGSDEQFLLSGTLSEWLFASKFWSSFNLEHGTIFDQFEDDQVSPAILEALCRALGVRSQALQQQENAEVEFIYRWTPEGHVMRATTSNSELMSELRSFRHFLQEALRANHRVILSL